MIEQRARLLQDGVSGTGPVLYWMSRDQRAHDNHALNFALDLAKEQKSFACVVFTLVPEFLGATRRQYGFLLKGLQTLETSLNENGIPFFILQGLPESTLPRFIKDFSVSALVTDFDPLRIKRLWKKKVAEKIVTPLYEVDAHNIVPCLVASPKEEFAAYTIRPKINRLLPLYLEEYPVLHKQTVAPPDYFISTDWEMIYKSLRIDETVPEIDRFTPGEGGALGQLEFFLEHGLPKYDSDRNDPTLKGQSDLSPYLHFGQISAQRVALEVTKRFPPSPATEAFLEELIVRRELADNFCYYNNKYDAEDGFAQWAKKTLQEHAGDEREYIYTDEQFENFATHDPLWNAAQRELSVTGKMHGYMRMYWAKKILEWSKSPGEALRTAIYLNDKYSLDGRDPNGYAGCAWAIGGVHDRAWFERNVFGKIRYMNYNGCKRKFNIDAYITHTFKISTESII